MSDEHLDFDAIAAEFDATYSEEEPAEQLEAETLDTEDLDTNEQTEEVPEDQTGAEEVETPEPAEVPAEDDKRNQAFAELRRKAQENEQAAQFLNKLANQSGLSPEEVLKRFEQKTLEAEAQKQGVPVEVMERLQTLEQENASIKEQTVAQRMDAQINDVVSKYNATEDDIRAAFQEMMQSGIDPRTNPNVNFEAFYRAANFDKILESKIQETKQQSLAQKKQRQQQAAIPNGTSVAQTGNSDTIDQAVADAKEILENW